MRVDPSSALALGVTHPIPAAPPGPERALRMWSGWPNGNEYMWAIHTLMRLDRPFVMDATKPYWMEAVLRAPVRDNPELYWEFGLAALEEIAFTLVTSDNPNDGTLYQSNDYVFDVLSGVPVLTSSAMTVGVFYDGANNYSLYIDGLRVATAAFAPGVALDGDTVFPMITVSNATLSVTEESGATVFFESIMFAQEILPQPGGYPGASWVAPTHYYPGDPEDPINDPPVTYTLNLVDSFDVFDPLWVPYAWSGEEYAGVGATQALDSNTQQVTPPAEARWLRSRTGEGEANLTLTSNTPIFTMDSTKPFWFSAVFIMRTNVEGAPLFPPYQLGWMELGLSSGEPTLLSPEGWSATKDCVKVWNQGNPGTDDLLCGAVGALEANAAWGTVPANLGNNVELEVGLFYDGVDTLRMYVNGNLVDTVVLASPSLMLPEGKPMTFLIVHGNMDLTSNDLLVSHMFAAQEVSAQVEYPAASWVDPDLSLTVYRDEWFTPFDRREWETRAQLDPIMDVIANVEPIPFPVVGNRALVLGSGYTDNEFGYTSQRRFALNTPFLFNQTKSFWLEVRVKVPPEVISWEFGMYSVAVGDVQSAISFGGSGTDVIYSQCKAGVWSDPIVAADANVRDQYRTYGVFYDAVVGGFTLYVDGQWVEQAFLRMPLPGTTFPDDVPLFPRLSVEAADPVYASAAFDHVFVAQETMPAHAYPTGSGWVYPYATEVEYFVDLFEQFDQSVWTKEDTGALIPNSGSRAHSFALTPAPTYTEPALVPD